MKTIGTILGSLAIGKLIKDSTQMAMGVETAVENINHNMGQAARAFQDWVDTQSKSLGMAKADAYNYGSTFSNLLSSFSSSAQETADQTQELMKAAAIIASRTGRTYDDVANRIRSGMLGSTEAIILSVA
jgi:Lon protease-like protein